MQLERIILRYLAHEQFCSVADIQMFAWLQTGDRESVSTADQLIAEWDQRGWIETIVMETTDLDTREKGEATLVCLTESAWADLPWLQSSGGSAAVPDVGSTQS